MILIFGLSIENDCTVVAYELVCSFSFKQIYERKGDVQWARREIEKLYFLKYYILYLRFRKSVAYTIQLSW